MTASPPRFGEQRLVRGDISAAHRLAYRTIGVGDPALFLRHRYLKRLLRRCLAAQPQAILDAGCGDGDHTIWLARRFPDARVVGVDIDRQIIERNRTVARRLELRNLAFEVGNLTTFEANDAYDLIISIDVLEHIPDQPGVLQRLCQALRRNGLAVFHLPTTRPRPVPLHRFLGAFLAWAEREHLAEEATAEEFLKRMERAGFRIVHHERTFGYATGELANSLFVLPFHNTPANRLLQLALAPVCRLLAMMDTMNLEKTRYALAVAACPARTARPDQPASD